MPDSSPPIPSSSPSRVVGIPGSLRKASLNRHLLVAAQELSPPDLRIEIATLEGIPFYNEDVEAVGTPAEVAALRTLVAAADGLLIAMPEYNYSVPGVLKNGIDWLSRPARKSSLEGKPVAIMGASPGGGGTMRGQMHLRQSFVFTNSPAMPYPEMIIARAREKFDAHGRLTDEATREHLARFLAAFAVWIGRFRGPVAA